MRRAPAEATEEAAGAAPVPSGKPFLSVHKYGGASAMLHFFDFVMLAANLLLERLNLLILRRDQAAELELLTLDLLQVGVARASGECRECKEDRGTEEVWVYPLHDQTTPRLRNDRGDSLPSILRCVRDRAESPCHS